ncbi:MAG: pilin [Candidatus Paceibacterota bacterium]
MKTKALIPIISLIILIAPVAVSAAYLGIVPCGCYKYGEDGKCINGEECTICHLFEGVSRIIDFLLKNIAFPLGVVAILYGGFMIMTSGGSEERVKKGKTALEFAIYGIIIAFAGWLIIGTILSNLVLDKTVWPFSEEWNTIPTSCPVK